MLITSYALDLEIKVAFLENILFFLEVQFTYLFSQVFPNNSKKFLHLKESNRAKAKTKNKSLILNLKNKTILLQRGFII